MPDTLWNAMLGAEVRYLDAGGVRTRYLTAGDGPPLLLLHGTGGHLEAWAHNIAALAQHFRVVVPDMVGHGLTDKPTDLEYVVSDYTAHVRLLMDRLDISSAHLAGISLGAWVASWLALEAPDRVERIVNCTGGVFRWKDGESAREATERKAMVGANEGLRDLSRDSVRRRLHSLFHDPTACTEELVDLRLALYSRPGAPELLATLHHMVPSSSPARARFALTEEHLAALASPVLYLWGEHNPGGSIASARRAAELTPEAELVVIDGTGHWPQWEAPEAFNDHVISFLTKGPLA